MTFNKWHPDRVETRKGPNLAVRRAWAMRLAWYSSTAMLVAGYVLMFVYLQ